MSVASQQMDELNRLFNTKEELNPELAIHLSQVGGYTMLRHPLVSCMIYTPEQNAIFNRALREKRKFCDEALAKGTAKMLRRYVWMHERPYRFNAFLRVTHQLSDGEYWTMLGAIWTDSENIWQNRAGWSVFLKGGQRNLKLRPLMMERAERTAFSALRDTLTIYRGGSTKSRTSARTGMSWTLDRTKARWFATRLLPEGHRGLVYQRTVSKQDVVAYFLMRGEEEIVTLPSRDAKLVWSGTEKPTRT